MKRLFIAVRVMPDSDFLTRLQQLKRELIHEKIKWVEDKNIHITLKFLGDTEEGKIPKLLSALGKTASGQNAFGIRLRSTGIFGSRYAPKVVWTGIEPYDSLLDLMKKVHEELHKIGFERDSQNLVPHLTLGRIREIRDKQFFQEVIERYKSLTSKEIHIREFTLYESILRKEGPLYIPRGTFPFET